MNRSIWGMLAPIVISLLLVTSQGKAEEHAGSHQPATLHAECLPQLVGYVALGVPLGYQVAATSGGGGFAIACELGHWGFHFGATMGAEAERVGGDLRSSLLVEAPVSLTLQLFHHHLSALVAIGPFAVVGGREQVLGLKPQLGLENHLWKALKVAFNVGPTLDLLQLGLEKESESGGVIRRIEVALELSY